MTRPRLYPDNARLTTEAKAWITTAGQAGATAWMVAVYAQCPIETVYRLWRVNGIERRQRPERRRYVCARCGHNGNQGAA